MPEQLRKFLYSFQMIFSSHISIKGNSFVDEANFFTVAVKAFKSALVFILQEVLHESNVVTKLIYLYLEHQHIEISG